MPTLFEIFRMASLYLCLVLTTQMTHAAGGAVFSSLSLGLVLPVIRWIVFAIDQIFSARLFVLVKLVGWAIASSGIVLGYYVFILFFRAPMNTYEYWICLLVSAGALSRIVSIMLFEQFLVDIDKSILGMKLGAVIAKPHGKVKITHDELKRNLRATFLDLCVPVLLQLAVTFSFFCFAASRLGIMETVGASQPELYNCLLSIAGLMNIGTSGIKLFHGWVWECGSFMFTLILFLWAAIIIQVANNAFAQEIAGYKYIASEWEADVKQTQDPPVQTSSLPPSG